MKRCLLSCPLLMASGFAQAADTIETFEVGLSDLEAGMLAEGVSSSERALTSTVLLGYGITPTLSSYYALSAGGAVGSSPVSHHLGVFGTLYHTHVVAFDAGMEVAGSSGGVGVSPWAEANVDQTRGGRTLGGYLRLETPWELTWSGASLNLPTGVGTLGMRWRWADRHEILLEVHQPLLKQREVAGLRNGVMHLGYNVGLTESLELISEIQLSSASAGGGNLKISGAFVGLIATLSD